MGAGLPANAAVHLASHSGVNPLPQDSLQPIRQIPGKKNPGLRMGRGKFGVQVRTARAGSRYLPTLNTT
ncbi:hypothetical protein D8767_00195 [Pseudomonas sp. LTGT-11-2Z]|nr:hypothetical protein D8767_00195 [Pseudomonas sp. LTGT-11-2Z]